MSTDRYRRRRSIVLDVIDALDRIGMRRRGPPFAIVRKVCCPVFG